MDTSGPKLVPLVTFQFLHPSFSTRQSTHCHLDCQSRWIQLYNFRKQNTPNTYLIHLDSLDLEIKQVQAEIIAVSAFELFWFSAGATKISLRPGFCPTSKFQKIPKLRNQTCNKSLLEATSFSSQLEVTSENCFRSKFEIYKYLQG